tara:strand:- start:75 stop:329 length:255 start_codon:yes stop_codon:yes gene_type:complete
MEQQELFKKDTTEWIYESPDGGSTLYRRKARDPHYKRELVKQLDSEFSDYRDWMYKQDWAELSKKPMIKESIDKLRVLVELTKE